MTETGIPGLVVLDLPVHGDARGWFKENWQRAKMVAAGLPAEFRPVQNNVSFNAEKGVTRGIHAEPWNKFISVAAGSVFGVWVDLRPGTRSARSSPVSSIRPARFTCRAAWGNSFQALEDGTAYTYLVDAHWSAELKRTYTFVNLADPESRDRVAHPALRMHALRGRQAAPHARRCRPHGARTHARHGLQRPARPRRAKAG